MTDMKEQLNILESKKSDEEKEEVETEVEIAEDTETKVDTEEQVKADAAFLREAEKSCAARKGEYLNRTELRSIELGGINKGLEILDTKRELLSHLVADTPSTVFYFFHSFKSSSFCLPSF